MKFSDKSYNLRIVLDTKHCDCTPEQVNYLEETLDALRKLTATFPVSDLYITVAFHGRSNQYRVKTSLVLPGRTIATGDVDVAMEPAYERCVRKLIKRIEAYKAALGHDPEQAKEIRGTAPTLAPARELDGAAINRAVEAGDYNAFREAFYPYEDALHDRIGRYVQRFAEVEAQVGNEFTLGDLVEEVLLNAFERYEHRPQDLRLGEWLEGLIGPSVKMMSTNPSEELQNISFVRSMTGTE